VVPGPWSVASRHVLARAIIRTASIRRQLQLLSPHHSHIARIPSLSPLWTRLHNPKTPYYSREPHLRIQQDILFGQLHEESPKHPHPRTRESSQHLGQLRNAASRGPFPRSQPLEPLRTSLGPNTTAATATAPATPAAEHTTSRFRRRQPGTQSKPLWPASGQLSIKCAARWWTRRSRARGSCSDWWGRRRHRTRRA
jgi:hypothetical protein